MFVELGLLDYIRVNSISPKNVKSKFSARLRLNKFWHNQDNPGTVVLLQGTGILSEVAYMYEEYYHVIIFQSV